MFTPEQSLFHYFHGKGLDTSRDPVLKNSARANVICLFKEPNNLYHFYTDEGIGYESFDFVFNNGLLTETKFFKILIKEWFYLLRIGGNLVIRFKEAQSINGANIHKILSNLIGDYGEILYVGKDNDGFFTVIVQKFKSVLSETDDINKWSFCIINPGNQCIEELVNSIQLQEIPYYEIIVDNANDSIVNQNDCINTINYADYQSNLSTSMKKNKMLLTAKYDNIVFIERSMADITLSNDWFREVKRYGNYFECLSCALVTAEGDRYSDWWTLGCAKSSVSEQLLKTSRLGLLEYVDWDDWVYFPDPVCILKKNLYQKAMWDGYSVDGEENIEFCHQLQIKGSILRVNPNLVCRVKNERFELRANNFPHFVFDKDRLGKRKGKFFRRMVWIIAEPLLKTGRVHRLRSNVIRFLKFIRIYDFIAKK